MLSLKGKYKKFSLNKFTLQWYEEKAWGTFLKMQLMAMRGQTMFMLSTTYNPTNCFKKIRALEASSGPCNKCDIV